MTVSYDKFAIRMVSPVEIPGLTSLNDWVVPGAPNASYLLRVSMSGPITITGIDNPVSDQQITIVNLEVDPDHTITLAHESSLSAAENRIFLPDGASLTISAGSTLTLYYDYITGRYRPWSGVGSIGAFEASVNVNQIHTKGLNYLTIKDALEANIATGGGAAVYVPQGTFAQDTPILLNRTDLFAGGSTPLIGAGQGLTRITCSASFPTELRGVIEWVPANYATLRRRAWLQRIEGLEIVLPDQDAYGIWYKRTDTSFIPSFEKSQHYINDVLITPKNSRVHVGIFLEGNVHDSIFSNLHMNCGTTGPHDSILLQGDFGPGIRNGNDDFCFLRCVLRDVTVTARSGGFGCTVKARMLSCSIYNIQQGRGSLGTPVIWLFNSGNVHIFNITTEGLAERPQMLFDQCDGIWLHHFNLGTPDPGPNLEPFGDGVEFRNTRNSYIDGWLAYPDKVTWDTTKLVKRVRLDENSHGNYVRITMTEGIGGRESACSLQGIGVDTPGVGVVVDFGQNNEIICQLANSGVRRRFYNQVEVFNNGVIVNFPNTAAKLNQYLGYGTWENLWMFDEVAAGPALNKIGAESFLPINAPTQAVDGIGPASPFDLAFDTGADGSNKSMQMATNTTFDIDLTTSAAYLITFYITASLATTRYLLGKFNAGPGPFWYLWVRPLPYGYFELTVNDGAGHTATASIEENHLDGFRHDVLMVVDRDTDTMVLASELGISPVIDISTILTLTNNGRLTLGGRNNLTTIQLSGPFIITNVAHTTIATDLVANAEQAIANFRRKTAS